MEKAAGAITEFTGEFSFLSNFHPVRIKFEEMTFPSAEHAYQAAKTDSVNQRIQILRAKTPGEAKKLGRVVTLRPDWNEVKLVVMREILLQKFMYEPLRTRLSMTNPKILIEGNTWGDTFWGVCRGEGQNHLGKLLMEIRAQVLEDDWEEL